MHGEMKDSQLDKVISKKMVTAAQCLLVAIAKKATFERKLPQRPVVPATLTISIHWSVIRHNRDDQNKWAIKGERKQYMCALCKAKIQQKTYHRLTKINHRFPTDQKQVFVKLKNFTVQICITDLNYANQSKNYFRPRRKICAELSCSSFLFCSYSI